MHRRTRPKKAARLIGEGRTLILLRHGELPQDETDSVQYHTTRSSCSDDSSSASRMNGPQKPLYLCKAKLQAFLLYEPRSGLKAVFWISATLAIILLKIACLC